MNLNLTLLKGWLVSRPPLLQRLCWTLSALCLSGGLAACWYANLLSRHNAWFQQPAVLLRQPAPPHDAYWAYARGYALQQAGAHNDPEQALKQFYLPESSTDLRLRALAKFAIGNLYFDWAMAHHAVEQGGAHQQQVAMIALAREAYKDVLRLDPDFAEARFNLELLDRRSPDKRTQGWQSETDGVTLKPFKRNGTAMMRDNRRRGLP